MVLTNGQRGVLMSIYKTGNSSTLSIVDRVKKVLADYQSSLPPELNVTNFFDQSVFVRAAIQGVLREALIAACLTAFMILLFLGNWKSTLIIAISIPLSILVSVLCLSALGETINIMTLGGLALAVGILVDDATVEIENINRNLAMGKETVQAILDGAQQIAVPAFVSTLCICIVFHADVFSFGRGEVSVRAAGRSGDFCDAGVVHVVADDRADDGDVPVERGRRIPGGPACRAKRWAFSGDTSRHLSMHLNGCGCGYRRALTAALDSAWFFSACFLAFCVLSAVPHVFPGARLFPERGRGADPAALARADGIADRGDRAAGGQVNR